MAEGLPHPELVIEAGPDRLRGSLLLLALLLREVTTLPLTLTLPLPLALTLPLTPALPLPLPLTLTRHSLRDPVGGDEALHRAGKGL